LRRKPRRGGRFRLDGGPRNRLVFKDYRDSQDRTSMGELRFGLIGSGFMGQVHADAIRRAGLLYPDLPVCPVLAMLADRDEPTASRAASRFGFQRSTG